MRLARTLPRLEALHEQFKSEGLDFWTGYHHVSPTSVITPPSIATSAVRAWAPVPEGSAFGVGALPYGVFSVGGRAPRVGVRIGRLQRTRLGLG